MVSILPCADPAERAALLEKNGVSDPAAMVLSAKEGGETTGRIAFILRESAIEFLCCDFGGDLALLDAMVRAAAAVAYRMGKTEAQSKAPALYEPLSLVGFHKKDDRMSIEMSQLFKKCCG